MELGNKAEWVGAIGTILAFGAVAVQLIADHLRRQRAVVREQAVNISAWLTGEATAEQPLVHILNNSKLPVYGVIVTVVAIQGAFPFDGRKSPIRSTKLTLVPPGEYEMPIPFGGGAMGVRFSVEICFKDAVGAIWLRNGRGELKRLKENPLKYYKIDPPVDWQSPTKVNLTNGPSSL